MLLQLVDQVEEIRHSIASAVDGIVAVNTDPSDHTLMLMPQCVLRPITVCRIADVQHNPGDSGTQYPFQGLIVVDPATVDGFDLSTTVMARVSDYRNVVSGAVRGIRVGEKDGVSALVPPTSEPLLGGALPSGTNVTGIRHAWG